MVKKNLALKEVYQIDVTISVQDTKDIQFIGMEMQAQSLSIFLISIFLC